MNSKLKHIEHDLLLSRAERLAIPIEATDENLAVERVLVFFAMGEKFAIPLAQVEAVTRIIDIFPIPHTPAHIPGVIRRRGQTIALVNLRFFFYPGTEALIDEDYAVAVRVKKKLFSLQIEDVEGVVNLLKTNILPVPDSYDRAMSPYLSGITRDDMAILNLDEIVMTSNFGTTEIQG
ncbi:MAG: chemotaxis protein CheW [Deltaproteobacteria bacterium]|nr:chemotaxis protein CheW [Deltaproteobacteria bacterium]MBN2672728.1 chemotaxis protein CheW [Deltaproteobacteria bacterium]